MPVPCDPATLFQLVKHGIERGQSEAQGAAGSIRNLFGDLKAVKRPLSQQRQDGNLSATAGNFGANTFHRMNIGFLYSSVKVTFVVHAKGYSFRNVIIGSSRVA